MLTDCVFLFGIAPWMIEKEASATLNFLDIARCCISNAERSCHPFARTRSFSVRVRIVLVICCSIARLSFHPERLKVGQRMANVKPVVVFTRLLAVQIPSIFIRRCTCRSRRVLSMYKILYI